MTGSDAHTERYDVFLSHGSIDKSWVRGLREALEQRGLRAYLEEVEIRAGGNWTIALSEAIRNSRSLALVLSRHTLARDWVDHEWSSYMASHGPRKGRIVPVLLDPLDPVKDLPPFLAVLQAVDATDRDVNRVADRLVEVIGPLDALKPGDRRRLYMGQDLVFVLEREGGKIAIADPAGRRRVVDPP